MGVFFDPGTLFSRFWGFWPLWGADGLAALEPLKQAFSASCDVMLASQICGSKLETVLTGGDTGAGCPITSKIDTTYH